MKMKFTEMGNPEGKTLMLLPGTACTWEINFHTVIDLLKEQYHLICVNYDGFDPIKDIPNGVYLTGFFSNYPTRKVMSDIMSFMDAHQLTPCYGAVYPFAEIRQALTDMDSHKINGKIVITV